MVINNYVPYKDMDYIAFGRPEPSAALETPSENIVHSRSRSDLEKRISLFDLPILPKRKSDYLTENLLYDWSDASEYRRKSHERVTKEADDLPSDEFSEVLGMYDPERDVVYIPSGLAPHVKRFVLEHEYVHRERHFGSRSQNESAVDGEAQTRLGYNPIPR